MDQEQVARLEASLAASIGHAKALEYAVRVLIASHPLPERFEAAWQALLPEIAATHTALPSNDLPHFRQALQQGLSVVSQTSRIAVQGRTA